MNHALANEIAAHLTTRAPWTATQVYDNGYHRFTAADGTTFGISSRDGRLHVSCSWPINDSGQENRPYFSSYATPPESAPEAGISATKTPKQIAADIERRFLPAFLPLWDKQLAQNQQWAAVHQAQHAGAARLAQLIGAEVRTDNRDSTKHVVRFPYVEDGPTRGVDDIDVSASNERIPYVNLKLSGLSIEVAGRVIALVVSAAMQEAADVAAAAEERISS